jgi:hypothetical protein
MFQPSAGLQHPDPRRGDESHLRGELACLLASIFEFAGELSLEEDDSLANRQSVLRSTETKNIDTNFSSNLFRCQAERGDGIRKSSPVDVNAKLMSIGNFRQIGKFFDGLDRPHFGRLSNGNDSKFRIINIFASRYRMFEIYRVNLPCITIDDEDFRAVGKNSSPPHSSVSI